GNIWNINPKEDRPGAQLNTEFFNQVAIGTGAGLRINANFFLLRFDLGIKVKDPALPAGNRFVMFNSKGGFRRSVFNIAIGYPF
ncbi:MAG: BamA/TamA family outer membrane protein, partial [Butyricimonas sp.]|nr:BamA/TamA family outer membrane protein [Butyricimonas sp.]